MTRRKASAPCGPTDYHRRHRGSPKRKGNSGPSLGKKSALVLELHRGRFEPLGARHHLHVDALAFLQLGDALPGQDRAMDEDILAAFHGNEPEALLRIVPFDLPVALFGRPGRTLEAAIARRAIRWPAAARTRTARWVRRAGIDGGDLGDLRAFGPLPHPHRQRRAGFERRVPGPFDDADVEEGFTGPIGQFDES